MNDNLWGLLRADGSYAVWGLSRPTPPVRKPETECRRRGCTHGQPALDVRPAGAR